MFSTTTILEKHVKNWAMRSRDLDAAGIYDDVIKQTNIFGMNVLELGSGSGIMTKKLFDMQPKYLISIDKDIQMLESAKSYLENQGTSVNSICTGSPPFVSTGDLDSKSINLVLGDYTEYTAFDGIDNKLDVVFLAFNNGIESQRIAQLGTALNTTDHVLKKGGRFIWVDGYNSDIPESEIGRLMFSGYELRSENTQIHQVLVHKDGTLEVIDPKALPSDYLQDKRYLSIIIAGFVKTF